jgi:hypothetical protein
VPRAGIKSRALYNWVGAWDDVSLSYPSVDKLRLGGGRLAAVPPLSMGCDRRPMWRCRLISAPLCRGRPQGCETTQRPTLAWQARPVVHPGRRPNVPGTPSRLGEGPGERLAAALPLSIGITGVLADRRRTRGAVSENLKIKQSLNQTNHGSRRPDMPSINHTTQSSRRRHAYPCRQ